MLVLSVGQEPRDASALHLFIHLMEAGQPAEAANHAEALRSLVGGSPHLEHMPSHIDMRIGQYAKCMRANERAARQPRASQVYPLHNLESL